MILVSGSFDQKIKIWSSQTFIHLKNLKDHEDLITSVVLSDQYLYSAGHNTGIYQWNLHNYEIMLRVPIPFKIYQMSIDGNRAAVGSSEGKIALV